MTRGFTLRCRHNEPVTVECEYYPSGSFEAALAQYHLVPRPEAKPAEPLHFGTWMQQRTERAHAEFMERTSRRLPCDATTEDIARYLRVPLT